MEINAIITMKKLTLEQFDRLGECIYIGNYLLRLVQQVSVSYPIGHGLLR